LPAQMEIVYNRILRLLIHPYGAANIQLKIQRTCLRIKDLFDSYMDNSGHALDTNVIYNRDLCIVKIGNLVDVYRERTEQCGPHAVALCNKICEAVTLICALLWDVRDSSRYWEIKTSLFPATEDIGM